MYSENIRYLDSTSHVKPRQFDVRKVWKTLAEQVDKIVACSKRKLIVHNLLFRVKFFKVGEDTESPSNREASTGWRGRHSCHASPQCLATQWDRIGTSRKPSRGHPAESSWTLWLWHLHGCCPSRCLVDSFEAFQLTWNILLRDGKSWRKRTNTTSACWETSRVPGGVS